MAIEDSLFDEFGNYIGPEQVEQDDVDENGREPVEADEGDIDQYNVSDHDDDAIGIAIQTFHEAI